MKDKYKNYSGLSLNEKGNYSVKLKKRESNILIVGIHGGGIEPGVSELVGEIAGNDFSSYLFEGTKKKGNSDLHITSNHFDEPRLLKALKKYEKAIFIHGCKDKKEIIYIGGRNYFLGRKLKNELEKKGFRVKLKFFGRFNAKSKRNICNKGKSSKGVQVEISFGLRNKMFEDISSKKGRRKKTKLFREFVDSLKIILLAEE